MAAAGKAAAAARAAAAELRVAKTAYLGAAVRKRFTKRFFSGVVRDVDPNVEEDSIGKVWPLLFSIE